MIKYFASDPSATATLLSVLTVIIHYYMEKRREKRKIARLVYQEIRRAQTIIQSYKDFHSYKYAKKIIPINSWSENLHLFSKDFTIDEIDTINNLYSSAEYIDKLVQQISDRTFETECDAAEKLAIAEAEMAKKEGAEDKEQEGPTIVRIKPPWTQRLTQVTNEIELIGNTTIYEKLAKIARYRG